MTNEKYYLSTIAMRMVTNLVSVVTYRESLPPIDSHDPSLNTLVRSRGKWNTLYPHFCRKPLDIELRKMLTYCETL